MKIISYQIAVEEGYNQALGELEQIIDNSEMDGVEINAVLDIIKKLKK
jgi:hypothetical protein